MELRLSGFQEGGTKHKPFLWAEHWCANRVAAARFYDDKSDGVQ